MRRPDAMSRGIFVALVGVTIAGVLLPAAPAPAATGWTIASSPSPAAPARGRLEGVTCPTTTSCFAVGSYHDKFHHTLPLVGRSTGTGWSMTPAPLPAGSTSEATADLRDVACVSATQCFAVGNFNDGEDSLIIEQWNGTAWSVVQSGDPPGLQFSSFFSIACRNNGACFAVGSAFDGTEFSPLVERWNGTSWSIVDSPNPIGGTAGGLTGVGCVGSVCFAVGSFISNTTHTSQTLVERWTGAVWKVVASPNVTGANFDWLKSVSCPTTTSCFAVGRTESGTNNSTWHTLIEEWNGAKWSIMSSPNVAGAQLNDLADVSCPSESRCTAVGHTVDNVNNPSTSKYLVVRWNGTAWSTFPAANPGGTTSVGLGGVSCPLAGSCIAVGDYTLNGHELALLESWNGTSWTVVSKGGSDSRLRHISCTSATNCFAVGDAFDGSTVNTLIERWNGTVWSTVASPNPGGSRRVLFGVSCPTTAMCMAVGEYTSGSTTKTLVERWNGTAWSIVASPSPGSVNSFKAVTCRSATSCFAVGTTGDTFTSKPLIERWNGASWTVAASPDPAGDNVLSGVSCPSATSCFAVGTNDNSGNSSTTLVVRWNGTNWSVATSPGTSATYNHLDDVTCTSATNCFAVGGSQTFFLDDANTIVERWNGTTWSIVPTPNNAGDRTLSGVACVSATNCTAVGTGTHPPLYGGTLIETWNGTSWTVVASPNAAGAYADELSSVSCASTSCFAVGWSTTDLGESTLAERK